MIVLCMVKREDRERRLGVEVAMGPCPSRPFAEHRHSLSEHLFPSGRQYASLAICMRFNSRLLALWLSWPSPRTANSIFRTFRASHVDSAAKEARCKQALTTAATTPAPP